MQLQGMCFHGSHCVVWHAEVLNMVHGKCNEKRLGTRVAWATRFIEIHELSRWQHYQISCFV